MKKLPMISGIILFISFFLPWVSSPSFGGVSLSFSGSQLASIGSMASAKAYLLYLVPLLGLAVAILNGMKHEFSKTVTLVSGVLILLMVLWGMMESPAGFGETIKTLAFGAWLTLIGTLACIASFFVGFND